VFTRIPRTGTPIGASRRNHLVRAGAVVGTVALGAGLSLVPVSANAAEVTSSFASGQFLSGTLLGNDLADVVALEGAFAENDGTQDKQTSKDPLNATVLQSLNVDVPGGVQADLGDFLDAGAVNQYAEAERNGVSLGASGAIGDDGAIGVGSVGSGAAGDLDLDLSTLLGSRFAATIADLELSLEAVAAQAKGNKTSASGDYTLAGAVLTFNSPAISRLTPRVESALSVVDQLLMELSSDDGSLGLAVDDALGLVGVGSADVEVKISTDLRAAVASLLNGTYGNGGVSFNLQTGAVSVDLQTLLGGDLNDLPPNTELLTDAVITTILNSITQTVATLAQQIVDRVELALNDANVTVRADLALLEDGGVVSDTICSLQEVPVIGDIVTGGGQQQSGGGLGGLLGGVLSPVTGTVQGIVGYTTTEVCDVVTNALPDLQTSVDVDIEATVGQLLDGITARAQANLTVLGIETSLDIQALVGDLGDGLLNGLFGDGGAIERLVAALNTELVNPAITGLTGDNSVGTLLRDLLSIKVNVQERAGGVFTETAVRVAVLPGAGSAATVNVAAASVGPNITTIVDPGCRTDCGPGGPGGPGDPGDDGDGAGTTPSASNRLAFTGIGIAALIAIILALLAAGAYLAREGYRRNHPRPIA
jgi:hypothetical protein